MLGAAPPPPPLADDDELVFEEDSLEEEDDNGRRPGIPRFNGDITAQPDVSKHRSCRTLAARERHPAAHLKDQ